MNIFIICTETLVITICSFIAGAYCEHKWMIEHGYRQAKEKGL